MSSQGHKDELVSIVIPAYNEGETLATTVYNLIPAMRDAGYRTEIVIVDDGSSDNTAQVIEDLERHFTEVRGVINQPRHGYGYAVRRGLEVFTGDSVVIAMADGSDSPKDMVRYFDAIMQGYDCAFGSRFSGDASVKNYPFFKRVVNRLGNFIIARLIKSDYDDFTNGFKAYRKNLIEDMQPLRAGQFNLTVEMSIKAARNGAHFAIIGN